ncbi:MAG: protein phosphatase [Planctomycetaceae bacterium]|nr:protein phosphatase [Planctomycetaceae bacterium]
MREIIPRMLWIGNAGDARNITEMLSLGVEAVVCVAADVEPIDYPRDVISCRFPLVDGGGNRETLVRSAISLVTDLIHSRVPTLVYCGAGMSRAPAIAAAALATVRHESPDRILEELTAGAPHDISAGLWDDVHAALR